jgi:murein DD-endopeptidase MepM/ murein hydrolase activator NlpD
MAEEKAGGLPGANVGIDVTKIPLYGQDDERIQELNKAQQDVASALEHRYDQPNWWKVAAGFAKPQLGGFLASLGSASEAMGENLENQRASMMPVAQMKLQIAQTNMLLGANKKVADEIKAWRDAHPGQTPSAQLVGDWAAKAPGSSVVKSLQDELKFQQDQQNQNIQRVTEKGRNNIPLTDADKAVLNQNPEGLPRNQLPANQVPPVTGQQPPVGQQPPKEASKQETPMFQMPIDPSKTKISSGFGEREDPFNKGKKQTHPGWDLAAEEGTDVTSIGKGKVLHIGKDTGTGKDYGNNVIIDYGNGYTARFGHLNGFSKDLQEGQDIDAGTLIGGVGHTGKATGPHLDVTVFKNGKPVDPASVFGDPFHKNVQASNEPRAEAPPTAPAKTSYYKPTVPPPEVEGVGSGVAASRIKTFEENAAKEEAPYAETIGNLQGVMTGPNYTRIKNQYDTAISMIEKNPDLARKVFAMMRKEPIQAALASGFDVTGPGFHASVGFPIEAFKDAARPDVEKAYADKLFSSLMNITMANLRAQGVAMGKVPQQEYMKALSGFVNPNMTSPAALNGLHHARADFDQNKEYFDLVKKERMEGRVDPNSKTPYADIHNNSKELQKLHKKFALIHKQYDDDYQNDLEKGKKAP